MNERALEDPLANGGGSPPKINKVLSVSEGGKQLVEESFLSSTKLENTFGDSSINIS